MQETDAIPSFDTHVCLVSQEAAANLLPATEPTLEPKHVVLVASPEMKGKADHLGQALKESLPSVSIEMVEMTTAYDLTVMLEELFNLFDRLKNQGRKVVVNVTGARSLWRSPHCGRPNAPISLAFILSLIGTSCIFCRMNMQSCTFHTLRNPSHIFLHTAFGCRRRRLLRYRLRTNLKRLPNGS